MVLFLRRKVICIGLNVIHSACMGGVLTSDNNKLCVKLAFINGTIFFIRRRKMSSSNFTNY